MSRSVNKTQIDIILDRMQRNKSIACGVAKVSKEVLADFWNNLTEDLNNAGPPIKNVTEWKKVWTDQKRYVRSKAAANLKNGQETPGGGGANQIKRLSATEQCIFDLVGIKKPTEANEHPSAFGLSDSFDGNDKNNEQPKKFMSFDEIKVEAVSDISSCSISVTTPPQLQLQDPFTSNESSCFSEENNDYTERKRRKCTTAELEAKKFKTQDNCYCKIAEIGDCIQDYNKNMATMIKEIGDSIQRHNEKMASMMKRICRSIEEQNASKSKKLKELERHHKVCEHLRLKEVESKIEKNKRLIEIEEIKILKMKKKKFN